MKRSGCLILLGLLTAPPCVSTTLAQTWPARPIQIIVPFEPGGATDLSARMIGERFPALLGQPGIAVNKPGAGTIIGTDFTTKAAPDGYTLLLNTSSMVKAVLIRKATGHSVPYDVQKDLDPVGIFYKQPEILMVHPSVRANTMKELIGLARAKPGTIRYGSTGFGSVTHLSTEYFANAAGIKLAHVPYKGGGSAIPALIRGDIEMMFLGIQTASANIKSGKVRAIGISSRERNPVFPDVPTLAEEGVGNIELQNWYALFAPARTPRPVLDRLQAALSRMTAEPDFRDKLNAAGGTTMFVPGEQLRTVIDEDLRNWGRVIAESGMQLE